jgi:hypothetical protein
MNPDHLNKIKAERQKVYGDPKENHEGIAQMWASILQPHWEAIRDQKPVPPHVVALLMSLLKINRMRLKYHEDNYVDVAVYLLEFAQDWQREHDGVGKVEVKDEVKPMPVAQIGDRHMALKNLAITRRKSEWWVSGVVDETQMTPGIDVEAEEPSKAAIEYARLCIGNGGKAVQRLNVFSSWTEKTGPKAWEVQVMRAPVSKKWSVVQIHPIDPEALATLAKEVVQ